jgi:ATP-dependent 26S proteasome regulatory subunit
MLLRPPRPFDNLEKPYPRTNFIEAAKVPSNEPQNGASVSALSDQPHAASAQAIVPTSTKCDALVLLINSHSPIITVETGEEDRLEELLNMAATRLSIPLYAWSVTTGLARAGGAGMYGSDQPEQALANISQIGGGGIFWLKDFARYCDNDRISRHLRDLSDKFRTARRSIVISAASLELPSEFVTETVAFELGYPDADELLIHVREVLADESLNRHTPGALDAAARMRLARNLVGLTEQEAMRTLRKSILTCGKIDAGLIDAVLDAKREALRTDGLLEPVRGNTSFADVAGLKRLRDWVDKRRNALTPDGQRFGLVPPKGVLITGVQGCGKSLAARAIAGEWEVELTRFDAGALYDKFIGESEKRLHRVFELAQKLSPVVLWIDEIEKAFASAGSSGDADAGLSQRLLASLLTWMQDRESGVFLVATSNNITTLPPEMIRKGRFDEIFFVDLPNASEREALFALHLRKRQRDPATFDVASLAAASEGFSGAEIEAVILSGLYTAYDRKQQLTNEILLEELKATQPLSVTRAEEIQAIRNWARSRAVPAN